MEVIGAVHESGAALAPPVSQLQIHPSHSQSPLFSPFTPPFPPPIPSHFHTHSQNAHMNIQESENSRDIDEKKNSRSKNNKGLNKNMRSAQTSVAAELELRDALIVTGDNYTAPPLATLPQRMRSAANDLNNPKKFYYEKEESEEKELPLSGVEDTHPGLL